MKKKKERKKITSMVVVGFDPGPYILRIPLLTTELPYH